MQFSIKNFFTFIIRLTILFGYVCFEYPCTTFKLSKIGVFMLVINVVMSIQYLYMVFQHEFAAASITLSTNNKMVNNLFLGTFIVSLASIFLILMVNFIKRKELFGLLKKIELIDDQVRITHNLFYIIFYLFLKRCKILTSKSTISEIFLS